MSEKRDDSNEMQQKALKKIFLLR